MVAVSSVPPPSGIDELVEALDAHRAVARPAGRAAGGAAAWPRWRSWWPSTARAALRALGGRREAERFLASQDPALDVAALVSALRGKAG